MTDDEQDQKIREIVRDAVADELKQRNRDEAPEPTPLQRIQAGHAAAAAERKKETDA